MPSCYTEPGRPVYRCDTSQRRSKKCSSCEHRVSFRFGWSKFVRLSGYKQRRDFRLRVRIWADAPDHPAMRPSSSSGFASRPTTSHSIRSASRFSQRPSSALSHRPGSSLSQRPTSRLSQRPPSRHAQRFAPQLRKLVENVTSISADDEEDFEDACDLALRTLETNRYTGLRVNLDEVEARIEGFIEKAQIKGQDVMATALSETQARLKRTVREASATTDEPLVRESLLPDHIHFLVSWSEIHGDSF